MEKIKLGSKEYLLELTQDECPFCHTKINPDVLSHRIRSKSLVMEVVLICPNISCDHSFIVSYIIENQYLYYFDKTIGKPQSKSFDHIIVDISPSFVKIYNEAFGAEQYNLLEICGIGYRKALEFLIKDYLILLHPSKAKEIEGKLLGKCINDYVEDAKIKSVAIRAAWLGNDETHYIKKWEDKTLEDLKKLIDLTLHWIEAEELTKSFGKEMPG